MSDIFISYASGDRDRAERFASAFSRLGWSTFWDREIPTGMTWREVLGRELTEARCMIVLWSSTSVSSQWVLEEADEGLERRILLPILLDEVRPPLGHRGPQSADFSAWNGDTEARVFVSLISRIERLIGSDLPPEPEEEDASDSTRSRTKTEVPEQGDDGPQQTGESATDNAAGVLRSDAGPTGRSAPSATPARSTDPDLPSVSDAVAARTLRAVILGAASSALSGSAIGAVSPWVIEDLEHSAFQLSAAHLVSRTAAILAMLTAASCIGRVRSELVLAASLAIGGVGICGFSFANAPAGLFAASALSGVAIGGFLAPGLTLVARTNPAARLGYRLAAVFAMAGFTGFLVAPGLRFLVDEAGWRMPMLGVGALALVLALPGLRLCWKPPQLPALAPSSDSLRTVAGRVLAGREAPLVLAAATLAALAFSATQLLQSLTLVRGISIDAFPILAGATALASTVAVLLAGRIYDDLSAPRRPRFLAAMCLAAGVAWIGYSQALGGSVIWLVGAPIAGFASGGILPLSYALMMRGSNPRQLAVAVGLIFVLSQIARVFGQTAAGVAFGSSDAGLLALTVAPLLVAAGVYWLASRHSVGSATEPNRRPRG